MSDAIDFAELEGQQWELLPARTVLSLFSAGAGENGAPGVPGANGQSVAGSTMMALFNYIYTFSDSSGTHAGSGEGSGSSGAGS